MLICIIYLYLKIEFLRMGIVSLDESVNVMKLTLGEEIQF